MGSFEPLGAQALRRDVVAVAGRDRNGGERAEAERLGELAIIIDDVAKDLLVVFDEVDLVHRQDDVPHAEQRDDDRVPMGLR
jgi:hypothetical protein